MNQAKAILADIPVISAYVHAAVGRRIVGCESVLDVGGLKRSRLQPFTKARVISKGPPEIDGCNLRYADNSFDAVVSIAVLEHVPNRRKFLSESRRVAKRQVIHWFPFGEIAQTIEAFKQSFEGYSHPCILPALDELDELGEFEAMELITGGEHLLLLATLYSSMRCEAVYRMAEKYRFEPYGLLVWGEP